MFLLLNNQDVRGLYLHKYSDDEQHMVLWLGNVRHYTHVGSETTDKSKRT